MTSHVIQPAMTASIVCLQARYRQIRQWQILYAVQAFGDKWRALERRKDRQRQAFDAAIELATDLDFQSTLEDARDQLDQAMSHEVSPLGSTLLLLDLVWGMELIGSRLVAHPPSME